MALKKFDAEKYLKDGAKTYSLRGEVEALIDRITAKEYDSVCMIGIGGTWAEWYPVVEVAKKYTDLPIYLENARSEERRVGKECRSRWSPYH